MSAALVYIVIGTMLIAFGGFMATYGWNLQTSKEVQTSIEKSRVYEQELKREGILKTVLLEVVINIRIINDSKFIEMNKEKLSKFVVYPRFETAALGSVAASVLFLDKKHREFFDSVNRLRAILSEVNLLLGTTEDEMRTKINTIATTRKQIRDGLARQSVVRELDQCFSIMLDNYEDLLLGWVVSELGDEGQALIKRYKFLKNQK